MNASSINWLAVVAATLAFYALGALWYSPLLFVKAWMKEIHVNKDDSKRTSLAMIIPVTFLLSLIMVTNLAFFLGDPKVTAGSGALYGFLTGFGWVAMSIILTALYEMRSWRYMLINSGYLTVGFTMSGLILGAWK